MKVKNDLAYKRNFIENNRDDFILKNVLNNQTTITKEIENFYDIGFCYSLRGNDYTKKPKTEKLGKIPRNLLEIINPFSKQGKLNSKLLDYERVRKQIEMENKRNMRFLRGAVASTGGIIGVPSFIVNYLAANQFEYNLEGAIISAGVGLAGILSLIKLVKNDSKRWEKPENIEFDRLKDSVRSADNFIRSYKIYERLK